MPTIRNKISARIHRWGTGRVFTPKDFLDLGNRGMVDVTLSQLVSTGLIRRLARGIYDYPKHSDPLGLTLRPDIDEIAHAIARRFRWQITPPIGSSLWPGRLPRRMLDGQGFDNENGRPSRPVP